MHLWQDGLVALLAAIGLASLLWAVVRGLFFSRPRTRPAALALLPARGDGERLEEQVRELAALDRDSGCFSAILLADCGLSEEGRQLAGLLAAAHPRVQLCGREELSHLLDGDGPL